MTQFQKHELAGDFPEMEGPEFEAFCDDIEENGVLTPLVILDGKILDGWNRYRAVR